MNIQEVFIERLVVNPSLLPNSFFQFFNYAYVTLIQGIWILKHLTIKFT